MSNIQLSRRNGTRVNVVCIVTNGETYAFLYDDAHVTDCLRTIGRFASDEQLGFSWYDAARVSQSVRLAARKAGR